jgi:hypothetical protein
MFVFNVFLLPIVHKLTAASGLVNPATAQMLALLVRDTGVGLGPYNDALQT